jgi:hypothetical protein
MAGAAVVVAQVAGVTAAAAKATVAEARRKGDGGSGRDARRRGKYGNIKMNNYFVFTLCQKSIQGDCVLF